MTVELDGSAEPIQRLGKFVLLRPLRKSSGGAAWLAVDVDAQRLVVIKRLSGEQRDSLQSARFRDEIQLSFRVAHPNLVRAIESGVVGDEVYLALEYVAGQDLEAIIERCRRAKLSVPLAMAAAILRQLLRGLEYAHAQVGFVHRDVSPGNVLVGYDGIARLSDYGFALFELRAARTIPGMSAGNVGFLAPEQRVQGAQADARADLFAVAALLNFALTGLPTFAGEDPRSKDQMKARLDDMHVPLAPELLTFLWRGLQQDPNDRYQSAREMGNALEMALDEPLPDERALGDWVSRLFAVEKAAVLEEIERWRGGHVGPRPQPISSEQITSPVPPVVGVKRRRAAVILSVASLGVIVFCVALIVSGRRRQPETIVVTTTPPPAPRVEQLPAAPPSEAAPVPPRAPAPSPPSAPAPPRESTATKPRARAATASAPRIAAAPAAPAPGDKPAVDQATLDKRMAEAKALARAGEITAARTLYAELADDTRMRARASTALAELEYREGHYDEAIARANAAMRAGVGAPAFFVRALAELKDDKPADAARDFQKVLNAEPANSDAREGLKRAEEQMRRVP